MDAENKAPEATVESLQGELTAERKAHLVTKNERDTAISERDQTAQGWEATQANLMQATEIIAGQKQTIDDLEARINDLQTTPAAFPVIDVDKAKYEVQTKSFQFEGKEISVGDLLKDKTLQKKLVKLGAGFLVKKEA